MGFVGTNRSSGSWSLVKLGKLGFRCQEGSWEVLWLNCLAHPEDERQEIASSGRDEREGPGILGLDHKAENIPEE